MSAPAQEPDGRTLYLGVDGGGTGCRARIETADGRVLGRGVAGPAATRFGIDKCWQAIETAWRGAMAEAGLSEADLGRVRAGIGVAGIAREGARAALEAIPHPFASISFASDAIIACLGAHNGADGGIVIVGTGSCGIARIAGTDIKVGGYGFPISDEGSGAYLGLRAVRMAMLAYDGRLDATALLEEVLKRFDHQPQNAVAWMDRATATDYATFAPMVVRHADQGDPAARRLMQEAAGKIEGICRALLDKGAPRLALVGGLGSVMEGWLPPDLRRRLGAQAGDAMDGAVILAGRAPVDRPA
ncbi:MULTISPECIES: BadF/BadG/BcrA/BcrD ATPase family protein [unclassified Chelatococcus]|uniref:BadF/BadG/BcrA/BcrD ATPase family protein n=1 Tax=unclassified Chelatococcus TaxID=2638111 RepID=UPI0003018D39|nr:MULTISPECIES: BadF/BadG/BcrA/BcrD ATPase family protein [unclassified Chelatococcus]ALA20316.1 N-acetylglucosamine kinase [Chelatococcus sp. CO-6]